MCNLFYSKSKPYSPIILLLTLAIRDIQDKLNEYEERILKLDKQLLTKDATLVEMAPAPLQIRKQWMKNIDKKGGCMMWMPNVDKLVLEMLANRTQPSYVQSNIHVVAKVIHPSRM